MKLPTLVTLATLLPLGALEPDDLSVEIRRVPHGGLQPQVAVGTDGVVHLVYFKGKPAAGDLYYVRSADGGETFSDPLRVNATQGSAVAVGTIRGAQLALGKDDRVHVAWNGSGEVKKPHGAPMLYTRLDDSSSRFEKPRDLMTRTSHLDGGGTVAADGEGNVYVVWHGSRRNGPADEAHRAVWVARSADGGETFEAEKRANKEDTGACGCCGLQASVDEKGRLHILYRTATRVLHRDMRLLVSTDQGETFRGSEVDPWRVPKCVMSQATFVQGPDALLGAWETREEVYFGRIDPEKLAVSEKIEASGLGRGRKHPALASDAKGRVLLAWTEGTGWNRGGALAWQLYDGDGNPVAKQSGRREGVPTWSFPAALATHDGNFVILY